MSTPAQRLYEELQPIHPPPTSFWKKYVFSIDHKVIGKQFLWAGLVFLLVGGVLAMMIRWQWAFPYRKLPVLGDLLLPDSGGVISPATYQAVFTMHGLIMIFFAVTPVLIGAFGNFLIPLMIGARDMAFPKLNMYSFWTFLVSQGLVIAAFLTELGPAGAGWTTYPPLSTRIGTPGIGQSLVILALFVTGVSSTMGAVNYVTTVIRLRAPGMTYMRLPLTMWGLWLTAILNAIFIPVLGSAGILLLLDRHFGTQFFIAGAAAPRGGDPILFQHLFWIFGHPEVYIMILPAWGILGDVIPTFARKPHHWYRGTVASMVTVTVLSAVVYGHHMFVTGMSPLLGEGFMLFTLLISAPSMIIVLNLVFTVWGGSPRLDTPMLFGLGTLVLFGISGLTGLLLGDISMDLYLHDTMFVVGHFHFTMAAGSFVGAMTGLYFWFPKMFGKRLDERLGKIHFWFTFVGLLFVFGGQLLAGYAGQQRRLFDPFQYTFIQGLRSLNRWTSYFAFALFLGQLAFVVNFFRTVFGEAPAAGENAWGATTLEWATASPPPFHNFDEIPVVVRGPHELSNPEVARLTGRDFAGQGEPLAGAPAPAGGEA